MAICSFRRAKMAAPVTGDYVAAKVIVRDKYDSGNKKNTSGRIIEILKRGTSRAVGTVIKVNGRWAVQPDGNIFRNPIAAPDAASKNAKEGDKVVIELIRFPQVDDPGEGVILEILGEAGEPDVELESVIRQFDLPAAFSLKPCSSRLWTPRTITIPKSLSPGAKISREKRFSRSTRMTPRTMTTRFRSKFWTHPPRG